MCFRDVKQTSVFEHEQNGQIQSILHAPKISSRPLLSSIHFFVLFLKEYLTYIEPIIPERWAKTQEHGEKNHLTICKQNFPTCDQSEA